MQWHEKFDSVMMTNGFKIYECDKCVYVKNTERGFVIICLYVDDILIMGSNNEIIKTTKEMFNCSDSEPGPTRMASQNRNPRMLGLFLFIYILLRFLFQKCRDPNPRPNSNGGSEPEPDLLRRFHLS